MQVRIQKTGLTIASVTTTGYKGHKLFESFVEELAIAQRVSYGWVKAFALKKESRLVWIEPTPETDRRHILRLVLKAAGSCSGVAIHTYKGIAVTTYEPISQAEILMEMLRQHESIKGLDGLLSGVDIAIIPTQGADLKKLMQDIVSLAKQIG